MLRKTLTILSLIGLLLSIGLWGASYFRGDYIQYTNTSVWQCRLASGQMSYLRLSEEYHRALNGHLPAPGVRIQGFDGWRTNWKPHCEMNRQFYGHVALPLWPLVMIFGSTLWVTLRPLCRRRKRKKLGLCVKCGYDLRASKERCPECGTGFS